MKRMKTKYSYNKYSSYSNKMLKVVLFLTSILSCNILFAQSSLTCKETNNWYFGNKAAITFNNGAPTALTNSQMVQSEGCASISDENGNLLMYTNGINVWDDSHVIMPNGNGLAGTGSSAQSAIIVPLPSNDSLYYIFTVKDWKTDEFGVGLHYSTVNIKDVGNGTTLNPLGDIINKNIPLDSNVREQVTAVYHANCEDIWIITHKGSEWYSSNSYLAYLLTSSGLNTTPVISSVGMTYYTNNRYGYLKPSHDGQKICSTLGRGLSWQGTSVEILDFNNNTGVISNPIIVADSGSIDQAYSSEFSPDNSILYSVAHNGSFIYQFDLSSGISSTIQASKTNIASGSSGTKSCLQLGPDNKIYVSKQSTSFLGVINNPNTLGTGCNYVNQGINLNTGTAMLGFPTFWKRQYIQFTNDTSICQGDSVYVGGTYQTSSGSYNDTSFGSNVCDSCIVVYTTNLTIDSMIQINQSITLCEGESITVGSNTYDSTGVYQDTIIDIIGCDTLLTTSLTIEPTSTYTQNISICGDTSIIVGSNIYTSTGTYIDSLTDVNGCDSIVTTILSILADTFNLLNVSICEGDTIITGGGIQTTSGTYIDTLVAANGCDSIVTTNLTVLANPTVIIDGKSSVSMCQEVSLSASGALSYLWNTGATSTSITESPNTSSQYSVIGTDANGCVGIDVFDLDVTGEAYVYLPNIFSPSSSQLDNKKLRIFGTCIDSLQLTIYDRWGELVYESKDATQEETNDGDCCVFGPGWNGTLDNSGKPLNSTSFAYILNGTYRNGEGFYLTGNIILK